MTGTVPSFIADDGAQLQVGDTREMFSLARQLVSTTAEIEAVEQQLADLKARKYELEHRLIPDAADRAETDRVGVPEANLDVIVEPWVKANIPEQNREEAHAWLEKNGHGDIIKSTMVLTMGRGDMATMRHVETMVREYLRGMNEPLTSDWGLEVKGMVPWTTLTAFVKEQVRDPEAPPLPLELLGATVGRVAKIKQRRARR